MRILDKKETSLCVERFKDFIENWADVETLFETLDNVMSEWVRYKLNDSGFCGESNGQADSDFYYLKKLRDIFLTDEKASR